MVSTQHLPSNTPPGLLRRFAAMGYDTMLLFGVLFTATLIPSLILTQKQISSVENEQIVHDLHPLLSGLPFQLYLMAVIAGFFCYFWLKNGQTLGMQAWRLKLTGLDGKKLTITQCVKRLLGACLSLLCLGAGFWWAWIDKDSLTWHDRLSKTQIVLLPKK